MGVAAVLGMRNTEQPPQLARTRGRPAIAGEPPIIAAVDLMLQGGQLGSTAMTHPGVDCTQQLLQGRTIQAALEVRLQHCTGKYGQTLARCNKRRLMHAQLVQATGSTTPGRMPSWRCQQPASWSG